MTDDTTTARRQLLNLLLDRVERGSLLSAERPLLRALITAEQDAADNPPFPEPAAPPTHTVHDALRRELADALFRSRDSTWSALISQAAAVQADNARVYGEYDALIAAQPTSVSKVLVQHDVMRKALADALNAGWHLNWEQLVDRARRTNENAMGGTPDDARCTAQYKCELGEIWTCTLNPGHDGDHVDASDGIRYWNDHVGFHPDTDASAAAVREPEPVFCSPLVTANCPGHTAPPYCERAASRPETTAAPIEEPTT